MAAVTAAVGVAAVGAGIQANAASKARKSARASADAAGAAAMKQEEAAQTNFNRIDAQGQTLQNQVMNEAKQYSIQELNALDQSLGVQQRNIAQQEKLMASIDPTLMEASQQALKLLRGERVDSLTGANSARTQQRQQLQNSLRAQGFGDGSSAALNALQKFDLGTAGMEQQQLQALLGTTLNSRVDLGASAGQLAGLGQAYGGIGSRNANLLAGIGNTRLGALSGAGQGLINSAGAQYTGATLRGQADAQYNTSQANMWGGIAGQAAGYGLAGAFGGYGKTTPTTTVPATAPGTSAGQSYNNYGNMA